MTEIKTAHERCKEAVLSELIAMGATADKPTRRAFDELVSDIIQREGFQNDLQNVAFVGVSQGAIMALDAVASGRWKVGALVSFADLMPLPPTSSSSDTSILLIHGGADGTIPSTASVAASGQLESAGYDVTVISWSIGTQPDAGLVNTMLDAAIETVPAGEGGTTVHSDRGAHYRWPGWLTRISDAKLLRSMSRKGYSQDNAACEGFFGRLKTELFYPRTGRPSQSSSLSARLMPTSDGTMRSASNYRWAHAVRSSIEKASA